MRQVRDLVVILIGFRPGRLGLAYAIKLITQACHCLLNSRKPRLRIIDIERHDLRGNRHLHLVHAFNLAGRALDLGGAGRAVHARDVIADCVGCSGHSSILETLALPCYNL